MGFRVSWISKENPYNTYKHMSCEQAEEEEEAMELGFRFYQISKENPSNTYNPNTA
jgi:hypothetical protein